MSTSVVLTLTGPDRVGIVEEVTSALLGIEPTSKRAACRGWAESSRCSCL